MKVFLRIFLCVLSMVGPVIFFSGHFEKMTHVLLISFVLSAFMSVFLLFACAAIAISCEAANNKFWLGVRVFLHFGGLICIGFLLKDNHTAEDFLVTCCIAIPVASMIFMGTELAIFGPKGRKSSGTLDDPFDHEFRMRYDPMYSLHSCNIWHQE